MAKLPDKTILDIEKIILHYQTVMRLQDWKITICKNISDDDKVYATLTEIDSRDKSALLTFSIKTFEEKFSIRRIIIHELTHILLTNMKEKYIDVISLKEKQLETFLKKPNKNEEYINLINSNSKLIDDWLIYEEEKICTMMEHILLKA